MESTRSSQSRRRSDRLIASLDGPSRTITVEPVQVPVPQQPPRTDPEPAREPPKREPDRPREPAR